MEAEPSTVLGCVRETTDLTLRVRPRHFHGASPTARLGRWLFRLLTSTRSAFRDCWMCRLNRTEPPYADPHVRWCGRGREVTLPPMPIRSGRSGFFSVTVLFEKCRQEIDKHFASHRTHRIHQVFTCG